MQPTLRSAAARLRSDLRGDRVTPAIFGAALAEVPPKERDEWLDRMWDLDELPPDAPDLPRGCVPYLALEAPWLTRLPSTSPRVDVYRSAHPWRRPTH